jgi:hypothetical protein
MKCGTPLTFGLANGNAVCALRCRSTVLSCEGKSVFSLVAMLAKVPIECGVDLGPGAIGGRLACGFR